MLRSLAGLAIASAVLAAPALAQNGVTEFGADVAFRWAKPSGGDGRIEIQTPVDFRVAFHNGNFAIEPRISAQFISSSGDNFYVLDPGLNILIGLSGTSPQSGTYTTLGASITFIGGTGMTSVSAVTLNGGVGLRSPMGKAATRSELLVAYTPKQHYTVQTTTLGIRLGFSFFN
jgi:hypothetical protein